MIMKQNSPTILMTVKNNNNNCVIVIIQQLDFFLNSIRNVLNCPKNYNAKYLAIGSIIFTQNIISYLFVFIFFIYPRTVWTI